MDKNSLLQEIKRGLAEGTITNNDLQAVTISTTTDNRPAEQIKDHSTSSKLTDTFFYIGAILIAMGVTTVVGSMWADLSSFLKVFITLGAGIVSFLSAVMLESKNFNVKINNALHIIAIITLPLGLNVLFMELGSDVALPLIQSIIAVIISAIYLPFLVTRQKEVYLVMGTFWPLYLFGTIVGHLNQQINLTQTMSAIEVILSGLILMVIGNYYNSSSNVGWPRFGSILQFFGVISFLAGFNAMIYDSLLMTLVYPLILVATMYYGIRYFQRAVFIVAALYLTGYFIWLTFKILPDTTFALIISGVIIMVFGGFGYNLQKRYLSKKYSTLATPSTPPAVDVS